MNVRLPQGFTLRHLDLGRDADALAGLQNSTSLREIGEPHTDAKEIRRERAAPSHNVEENEWVVEDEDGRMVASMSVFFESPARIQMDGYVDPTYEGRGLGTAMLALGETRAREIAEKAPAGERSVLHHGRWASATSAFPLFEANGYGIARYFFILETALDARPAEPRWPEGINVRTHKPGRDDRAVFDADDEAFRDHWGWVPATFEDWHAEHIAEDEAFDPSLWFIAWDGAEIAGVCLCKVGSPSDPAAGWVDDLAVRRPWRGRGLGLSLLLLAFGEFFRRGNRRVMLEVDAENTTGALRLYERAGMRPHQKIVVFEKELRPGD